MTREEAIKKLTEIIEEATAYENAVCYVTSEDAEALDMAMEDDDFCSYGERKEKTE